MYDEYDRPNKLERAGELLGLIGSALMGLGVVLLCIPILAIVLLWAYLLISVAL